MTYEDFRNFSLTAKFNLSSDEEKLIFSKVNTLMDTFKDISAINTEGIEPLISPLDMRNVFREDVCVELFTREEVLAGAPEQYEGYYQVPKTID